MLCYLSNVSNRSKTVIPILCRSSVYHCHMVWCIGLLSCGLVVEARKTMNFRLDFVTNCYTAMRRYLSQLNLASYSDEAMHFQVLSDWSDIYLANFHCGLIGELDNLITAMFWAVRLWTLCSSEIIIKRESLGFWYTLRWNQFTMWEREIKRIPSRI